MRLFSTFSVADWPQIFHFRTSVCVRRPYRFLRIGVFSRGDISKTALLTSFGGRRRIRICCLGVKISETLHAFVLDDRLPFSTLSISFR